MHGPKFDSFKIDYNSIMTRTRPVERENIDGTMKLKVSQTEMNIVENTLVECLRYVFIVIKNQNSD